MYAAAQLPQPYISYDSASLHRRQLTSRCWCAQEEHVRDHLPACSERSCDLEPCRLACERTQCPFDVTCCARGHNDTGCCYVPPSDSNSSRTLNMNLYRNPNYNYYDAQYHV